MAQSQARGGSPLITLLLFLAVFSFFILQMSLAPRDLGGTGSEIPETADVAVIGGTVSAMLSALEAAENGAQVFLFPNGQELGEDATFLVQEGLAAALTPPQKELSIELSPATFGENIGNCGGWLNDPLLLESFQRASADFYPLSRELCGLSFSFDYLPDPETNPHLHLSRGSQDGSIFKQQLILKLKKSPVIIKKEKVKEILYSPEGAVAALLVENSREKACPVYFQAVILADGGYSGDLQRWHNYLPSKNLVTLRPDQKGEGLRMAEKMGVDLAQMGFFGEKSLLYNFISGEYSILPLKPWEDTFFINKNGELLDWSDSSPEEIFNFITQSPSAGAFMMVSGDKIFTELAPDYETFFNRFEELQQVIDALSLEDTSLLRGLRLSPPFYVAHLKTGIDYTLGGILTTPAGEVKKDGKVVQGLYAAGEIIGGLHGKAMLPGMPLSETIFSAKNTGKAAAAYAQR